MTAIAANRRVGNPTTHSPLPTPRIPLIPHQAVLRQAGRPPAHRSPPDSAPGAPRSRLFGHTPPSAAADPSRHRRPPALLSCLRDSLPGRAARPRRLVHLRPRCLTGRLVQRQHAAATVLVSPGRGHQPDQAAPAHYPGVAEAKKHLPQRLPEKVLRTGTPYGTRTRVTAVRGRRPRPLDERGTISHRTCRPDARRGCPGRTRTPID